MTDRTRRAELLTKENIKDIYTLSPMQEGMLFHALLDQNSASYFQQVAYRVQGQLDIGSVEKALDQLVARHDALRTIFKYKGVDIPLQIVLKEWKADFVHEDLRHLADAQAVEAYIRQFKDTDRARTFDLTQDALMRVSLLQIAGDEYEFIWSHHHILMDGWCLGMLTTEFFEIYNDCRAGRPSQLPPVQPYSSYIKWLESRDRDAARQFWQGYLDGYSEPAPFPAQKSELEQEQGYLNEKFVVSLDEQRTDALRKLAASHHVTLYQVVQSVWGILLAKYNSTRDVICGSVVSGRPPDIEGVEHIIGLFINTIPLRIRCEDETPFSTVLAQVKEQALFSTEHSYFPLNEIQALSELKGSLFDHIIVFDNLPSVSRWQTTVEEATLKASRVETFEQTNYSLCLDIGSRSDALTLAFTYNAHVHAKSFIERTAGAFALIVDQVLAQPDIPFKRITTLTPEDRTLLERFNATDREFSQERSVVQIIDSLAASQPDATAIVYNGKRTSYGELSARSSTLAHYLRELSQLDGDDRVALLMERSDLMLESILAIWKIGAAYVPVDIDYPPARIVEMISDAGAKLVLTDSSTPAAVAAQLATVATVVPLHELPEKVSNYEKHAPDLSFKPNSLAYVIYTSGSTGQPKGSMIEHPGMLNHLYAKIDELKLTARSIVAQNASHCFDISVWQFLSALMVGGITVIYDKGLVMNPEALLERVAADEVTVLEVVPSYLSVLLGFIEDKKLSSCFQTLSQLLVTGETVKPQLIKRWFKLFPHVPVINAYGPTEASDDITHYRMTGVPLGETIPIGTTLQNLKIYIADEHQNLCPVGIKGEILVSGIGVGRGYLNDPSKTAQAFTTDPFRTERGVRLYKTGDIGRYLENGVIEFFGRKDNQVKIRGFRIELEEIENTIIQYRSVREAVVVDKKNASGDTVLSCYLVANGNCEPEALREFVAAKLPDYMIPVSFTILDKLPVTPGGKLDRKFLRDLPVDEMRAVSTGGYVAPSSETEAKLVQLWQDLLKVQQVGVRDNFFELGGDSFKAIRMVSKFGKGFLVPDLYKYPTIEKLADFIQRNDGAATSFIYKLTPDEDKPKYAIIAVPNSAGEPSIYQETATALRALSDEYAVYGVVLPRHEPGPDETMQTMLDVLVTNIVAEIKKRIQVPVILYGQCNGSALTLQLARRLEAEQVPCRGVCMSAQLPLRRILAERDTRTDEEVIEFLDSLAATYPASLEDQLIFMRNFRYDGIMARVSYNQCLREIRNKSFQKLTTPLYSIIGTQDPLTKNYKHRFKDWLIYANQVDLIEVPEVGHFIWRDKPEQLAEILFRLGEDRLKFTETAKSNGLFSKLSALLTNRSRNEQTSRASRN